jgi:hypothetical protein
MAEYRRVTLECADRDWADCRTHDEVAQRHRSDHIWKQFLTGQPATWYAGDAVRDRTRDAENQNPRPGTRLIGSLKTETHRAWVWEDDGSVYDTTAFGDAEIHWMIAYGNRRRGQRSDLQEHCKSLLLDPYDSWRSGDDDYKALLAAHDDNFSNRAVSAVRAAIDEAERHHNTVVSITSDDLEGSVIREHDADVVDGVVIVEIGELWVIFKKQRPNGRYLTYDDAVLIAGVAAPDGVDLEVAYEEERIRDGLYLTDPGAEWVLYAELD